MVKRNFTRSALPVPWCIPWATGRFYSSPLGNGTGILATGKLWFRVTPIYVPNPAGVLATAIGIEVQTAGAAGALIRLGIYKEAAGLPTDLLLDAGTVAGDPGAVPVFQSIAISQYLHQGWYFLATATSLDVTVRAVNGSPHSLMLGGFSFVDNTPRTHYAAMADASVTPVFAVDGLPAVFPLITGQNALGSANVPRVMLGV